MEKFSKKFAMKVFIALLLFHTFKSDLKKQTADLIQISELGNICFCGDLNIAFPGRTYPSKIVQQKVSDLFDQLSMTNLTKGYKNNALHTVFSSTFLTIADKVKSSTILVNNI